MDERLNGHEPEKMDALVQAADDVVERAADLVAESRHLAAQARELRADLIRTGDGKADA
jgi:hypothetical protein